MRTAAARALVPGVDHRTVEVGPGLHLHVAEAGPEDGPLALLLHGFPDFWYSWRRIIPALVAAGHRVVAPDLRGYGASSRPAPTLAYRMDRHLDDLQALLRALGRPRAHLVGHDWGGAIAWVLASEQPALVDQLVVLNAPHPGAFLQELANPDQLRKSWYMLAFQVPMLPERLLSAPGALERWLDGWCLRPETLEDQDRRAYRAAFPDAESLRGPVHYYRAMLRYDLWTAARRARPCPVPTTVIWGEQDAALGTGLLRHLDRWAPNHTLHRLPDAGHFVHFDQPERCAELVVRALTPRAGSAPGPRPGP
ncbi:alpha/beta fold hydrolase [Myxococcota bacterium]|nr:alpha/beta fold hydrolase [Myxococcota bacterium]